MKISLTTAIVVQLAARASCAPGAEVREQKTTFSLQQVKNNNYHGVDAPTALVDAFAKFGKPIPKAMLKAIEMNPELGQKFKNRLATGGKVTASIPNYPSPFYDSEYVVPVQIGTPPQTMYLNLDTGSADLYVQPYCSIYVGNFLLIDSQLGLLHRHISPERQWTYSV